MRLRLLLAAVLAVSALALCVARSWRIDFPYSIDFQVYWLAGKRGCNRTASLLGCGAGGQGDIAGDAIGQPIKARCVGGLCGRLAEGRCQNRI